MKLLYVFLMLSLCSCITVKKKEASHRECPEKIRFVDIETYKDWGATNLHPIGRRQLPTDQELRNSSLWKYNNIDRAYEKRMKDEEKRHQEAVEQFRRRNQDQGIRFYP